MPLFFPTYLTALLALPLYQGALAGSLYTLTAIRPSDTTINNATLTALSQAFYINASRAPCPPPIASVDCPSDHETIVSIGGGGGGPRNASTMLLTSSGPVNQFVYIDATGLLSYVTSGGAGLPDGAVDRGFSVQPSNQPGSAGNLIFSGKGAQGWMACTDESNGQFVSRVYANVTGITDADVSNMVPTTVGQCGRIDIALTLYGGQNFISLYP